jgi:hypothetical protein
MLNMSLGYSSSDDDEDDDVDDDNEFVDNDVVVVVVVVVGELVRYGEGEVDMTRHWPPLAAQKLYSSGHWT